MGAVYAAVDPVGRRVALKVLTANALDELARSRFKQEAVAAARLSHPNVARVHSSGDLRGVSYIAFELVTGGSLAGRLKADGPLPWRDVARLGAEIALGLEAIHGAGLIHRDMKPDNVLLDEEGHAKISDLGIARVLGTSTRENFTKTGELLGTPAFMSPEQIDNPRAVDARTDVYALGATLFALLVGKPPFEGAGHEVLVKVIRDPPRGPRTAVPEVPLALDALILACLEKDKERRPRTALALAEKLEAIASGPAEAPVPKSRKLVFLLAGLAAIGIGGGALAAILSSSGPRPSGPPARSPSAPPPPVRRESASELLERARAKLETESGADAVALATSALEIDPGLAGAYATRAAANELEWRLAEALSDADKALALPFDPKEGKRVRGEALAAKAAALAGHAVRASEWEEVRKDALDALGLADAESRAHALAVAAEGEATFRLDLPEACREPEPQSGNNLEKVTGDVIKAGASAARLHPRLPFAALDQALGQWTRAMGADPRDFLALADVIRSSAPRNPWGPFLAGIAASMRGDFDKELELVGEAVRMDRRVVPILALDADILTWYSNGNRERRDLGVDDANEVLEDDPDNPSALLALGVAAYDRGEYPASIRRLKRLLELNYRHANGWRELGLAYRDSGDLEDAAEALSNAVKHSDLWVLARQDLVRVYVDMNDRLSAQHYVDTFFSNEFDPGKLPPADRVSLEDRRKFGELCQQLGLTLPK
jgi:serine/threonine-protein kinase